jgi:hypothetical protein
MLGSVKVLDNLVRSRRQQIEESSGQATSLSSDVMARSYLVRSTSPVKCEVIEGGQSFGHRDPACNVDPLLRATLGSEYHGLGLPRHDTH